MKIYFFCKTIPILSEYARAKLHNAKANPESLEEIHSSANKRQQKVFFLFTFLHIFAREVTLKCVSGTPPIVYGLSPPYLKDFICLKQTSYNFRYTNLLDLPRPKSTRYGTNSFRFQAAKLWNSLPEEARRITDFNSFKSFIKGWSGTQCGCALCR